MTRCRNINLLSIGYAFRPRLRTRLTHSRFSLLWKPIDFRRTGFSPVFVLLMPTFSLPIAPPNLTVRLQRDKNAPLPRDVRRRRTLSFGAMLSPGMFSAQENLTSELLRFL